MVDQLIAAFVIAVLLVIAWMLADGHGRHTRAYVHAHRPRPGDPPKYGGMW